MRENMERKAIYQGFGRSTNVSLAVLICMCAGIGFSGCAGKTPPKPETVMEREFDGAPDWVRKHCGCYWDKKEGPKKICGVGSCGGTRNPSMARTTAIARARTDIARTMQTGLEAMLKDYQATTSGGEHFGTQAADEQHVQDVSKQITEMSLSGTEFVDSWISKNGTFYALVACDMEKFKDAVNAMNSLSESVRRAVIQNADKAFADLEQEMDKRHQ